MNFSKTLQMVAFVGLTVLCFSANAAVDVSAPVETLKTDGTSVITAIGTALLALAGLAVIYKWAKAAFFS